MDLVNWLDANGVVLGLLVAALGAIPGWLVFIRKPAAAPARPPSPALAAILLALLVSGIALIVIALVGLPGVSTTSADDWGAAASGIFSSAQSNCTSQPSGGGGTQ